MKWNLIPCTVRIQLWSMKGEASRRCRKRFQSRSQRSKQINQRSFDGELSSVWQVPYDGDPRLRIFPQEHAHKRNGSIESDGRDHMDYLPLSLVPVDDAPDRRHLACAREIVLSVLGICVIEIDEVPHCLGFQR